MSEADVVVVSQRTSSILTLADFDQDQPLAPFEDRAIDVEETFIEGVQVRKLLRNSDGRGHLTVLHSVTAADEIPPPHIYQVYSMPGSIRAWVYHREQIDRLSFTNGEFEVALYDLRPKSRTFQLWNTFHVGEAAPSRITIPPFVVHGVCNVGSKAATFVNTPTAAWRRESPDKARLQYPDPRLPYVFRSQEPSG